jgi:hypothetical protein
MIGIYKISKVYYLMSGNGYKAFVSYLCDYRHLLCGNCLMLLSVRLFTPRFQTYEP